MFETFDFDVLDSADFKEDAVREELVAPMLKRLGYLPSGDVRVQRSKTLVHPFVRIGTRKQPVNIVPDYTLWLGQRALLVLDAKRPTEAIVQSYNTEQAYSYAIHPEIRTPYYALCNGRRLVVFDVQEFDPILDMPARDFDQRWHEIEKVLRPANLLNPVLRNLQPDLGLAVLQMGVTCEERFNVPSCRLQMLTRVSDEVYSASCECEFAGSGYIASFDLPPDALEPLLSCLAQPLLVQAKQALSRSPYHAYLDFMIEADLVVQLGPLTRGEHDSFVPFLISAIADTRFNRNAVPDENEIPLHVFRLRRAFEELQSAGQ